MLTGSQMIEEATRRLNSGEDPEIVLENIFGPVLNAVAYAARKSRALTEGDDCDADDLIRACDGCADVIGEEVYEDDDDNEEEVDEEVDEEE